MNQLVLLGEKLREKRKCRGWSRKDLMEAIRSKYGEPITERTIMNIENGMSARFENVGLILGALTDTPKANLYELWAGAI